MATQLLTPRSNEQLNPKEPHLEVWRFPSQPAGHCKAIAMSCWQTNVNKAVLVRWGWGWGWWSLHLHFTQTFKQMASLNWHPNQWLAPGFGGRVSVIYFNAAFSLFWLIGVIMKITFPSSLPTTQNLTCWAFNVSFKIQIFVCITLSACLWTSVIFEWPAPLRLRDFPGLAN